MAWEVGGIVDTSPDLEFTAKHLESSKTPEEVFGKVNGTTDEKLKALTTTFRRVAKAIHPDRFNGSKLEVRAKDAFAMLTTWKEAAEAKIRAGSYGDGKPFVAPAAKPTFVPQVVKTAKMTYELTKLVTSGDLADLYACTFKHEGKEVSGILKVSQSPADNDLVENEAKTLTEMYPMKQVDEKFYRYLPKFYDSFMLRGPSKTNRRVTVIQRVDGYYSLAEIMKEYPKGVDYRDAVWMFKRVLAGIGFVHKQKDVVHGALVPTHILVHPTEHGAKIVDWCYSVRQAKSAANHVKALSKPYKAFYAPEILDKKPPTPQTDLFMVAKCMVALLGGNIATNQMPATVPKQFQAFLGSCLLPAQHRRPDDAWSLHEDLDKLLSQLVGKPKYRPLFMPPRT
jgi:serine/threonine protein kinase